MIGRAGLWSYALLVCAACGGSSSGGGGSEDSGYPDAPEDEQPCDPTRIEAFPAGEPVWSEQDLAACSDACPLGESQCRQDACPGSLEHDACVLDTLDACLTEPGAECRETWEAFSCCSAACDNGRRSEPALLACIERECGSELDDYAACADAAVERDHPCVSEAEIACLIP